MDRTPLGPALRPLAMALLAGAAWSVAAQDRAPPSAGGALPPDAAAAVTQTPEPPAADEAPDAGASGRQNVTAAPVAPGLGPDEVGRRVAEAYGVELLRVRETEVDGRPAYAVSVMLPGGNRNNAFQVVTVLADPETGDVLPTFRHLPAGVEGNPGLEAETSTEAGIRAMRRLTFR